MTYETFEHTADIGVRGKGKTAEEAFEQCAKAMISVMVDLETVNIVKTVKVEIDSEDLDSLLIEFLNEILAQIDITGIIFSEFKVKIENNKLTGELRGEDLNPSKHNTKTEVKAATFHQTFVKKNGEWIAQCIVDV